MAPGSIDDLRAEHERKVLRRAHLREQALGASIGVAYLLTGIVWSLSPGALDRTFIGQGLPGNVEEVWSIGLALSALVYLAGLWLLSARLEAVGAIGLSVTLAVDTIAVFSARAVTNASLAGCLFLAVAVGLAVRAYFRVTSDSWAP